MQHFKDSQSNINIVFCIITENISFIPNAIVQSSYIIPVKRPLKEKYNELIKLNNVSSPDFIKTFFQKANKPLEYNYSSTKKTIENNIINGIDANTIMNIKEIYSFSMVKSVESVPSDIFNIICDNIISEIKNPSKIVMTSFRDKLYDILTYNLDVNECLWYIIYDIIKYKYSVDECKLKSKHISDVLTKTYPFFKFFNNNYRPIFHLESIMYYIINTIHNINLL